jgi:hypothetical protein
MIRPLTHDLPNGFALLAAGREPSSETETAFRLEKAEKRGAYQPSSARIVGQRL